MRGIVLAAALVLAGCKPAPADEGTKADLALLRSKVDFLEGRLTRLEHRLPEDYATMKPGDKNWQWVDSGHLTYRIGINKVVPEGNGSKVTLTLLNAMSVNLRDCSISITWGETDKSGYLVDATKHSAKMEIDGNLPAGDFAFPSFTLPDIPPAKLGLVTAQDLDCQRTAIAALQ